MAKNLSERKVNFGQEVCRFPKVSTNYKLRLLEAELEADIIPFANELGWVSRIIQFLNAVALNMCSNTPDEIKEPIQYFNFCFDSFKELIIEESNRYAN